MAELPTGTVTFLFTDLEGSTRLWEAFPEAMKDALARHDAILRESIEHHDGVMVNTMGDGLAAAFGSAPDAVRAGLEAQQRLGRERWDETGPLRARMGLYTGEGRLRAPEEYVNRPLNRCARVMAVGHGGQVLLAEVTAAITRDELPPDATLLDLGEHRLRDLGEPMRVYQLAHPGLQADFPPLRSMDAVPGNLPHQATTFVGREEEIAALIALLSERSVVTVTGVGGVGKTRLAIQVAAELTAEFVDGAWLCELAAVSDPDLFWDTVAASLDVRAPPGRSSEEVVLEYLGPKRLLLVLDNCEHLLDAAARAVDQIAKTCAKVVVLATSREGMAVAGEQIVAVPSLGLPAADASLEVLSGAAAVHLFMDRAHDAKRDFALTDRNGETVAQLCRRLDGIPLAIELAAARVRSLPPEDLVARLDQRFKLLTRGSRAALERHQTLRNTIDWSYDLLGDTEREALNRLSVFAGGADLAAAEAVVSGSTLDASDVADALSQLVDKSLVGVDEDDAGVRYRLLESIRQYAQERLEAATDAAAVRRRHADYYVARAEAAGPHLRRSEQIEWAGVVARDIGNFRAAIDWAIETPSPEHALRIVTPLAVFGTQVGLASFGWAEAVAEIPGVSAHPLFPVVASWAALGISSRGDLELAAALLADAEAAEVALGTHHLQPWLTSSTLGFYRGDLEQARRDAEAAVELARPTNDPYDVVQALTIQGVALGFTNPEVAIGILDEAVGIARDADIASVLSTSLMALAMVLPRDEIPRALALWDESAAVGSRIGDQTTVLTSNTAKAAIALQSGEWREALRATADAAEHQLQFGQVYVLEASCLVAAVALVGLGELEPAAVLMGVADVRGRRPAPEQGLEMRAMADAALLAGLGADRLAELRDRGMGLEPAACVACLRAEADRVLGDA